MEPICAVLAEHGITIAPSTYYDNVTSRPLKGYLRDAEIVRLIDQAQAEYARRTGSPRG